jgi:hypothetical protein
MADIREEFPPYKKANLYYLFKFLFKTRVGSLLWVGSMCFGL